MLFAFSFTEWYLDAASAQAPKAPGEPPEVAPPLAKLFDFLAPFVTIVGIAMFVTNNDSAWLAITLIVVGGVGSAALRRVGGQSRSGLNA